MINQPRMLKDLLADEESMNSSKKLSPKAAFKKIFKYLKFNAVKLTPLVNTVKSEEIFISTVRVKDILRWKSFKDPEPLDHFSSTTTTETSTGSSSRRSSWCDSDFTADDSELFDDKFVQSNAVKEIISEFETSSNEEQLLLDLFSESNSYEIDCELVKLARNWMSRSDEECEKWRFGGSKEMCMREIEWRGFEEETEDLGMEIENEVLRSLMNEVFADLCC